MREGEIHTLLLGFLDIDWQLQGAGAPGISLPSWRAEDLSGYRPSVSMLSFFSRLGSYPYYFFFCLHSSPPCILASHPLSLTCFFCLSSPTLSFFFLEWVFSQQSHLLRCSSFQAPSHLQPQAGAPAHSSGRSPHTTVMGSLLRGLALVHSRTWLRSELAIGRASEDKLPSPKLWRGYTNWNN